MRAMEVLMSRRVLMEDAVRRGKYAPLFHHLEGFATSEWKATFLDLERILGFALPKSARLYRPWWANDAKSGHSQSMAWTLAGWKTGAVDLDGETLVFRRDEREG
jgi:hypothetical protein